ncbi:MAG TPA: S41 family peptidase [Bryobacteraceae bacterium]|jgi:carboxyl-terminal processing protease|nr:S41 family peptidase [Bryobacteraceae bacterium]
MNRRFQFSVVAGSTCVVALLLFGAVRGRSASTDNPYNNLGVYSEVLSKIKLEYVEEPDMKAVTLGAINGMLESIDPYASYLNADQYKQYVKTKDTKKGDIGLVVSKRFGYMGVVDALPGSPAAKAGLATGDVIESITGVSTRDMPLAFAELLFQGDPGTTIEMSVLRARKSEAQKVELTRAVLVYPALTAKLVTDQGAQPIGLIQTVTLVPGRVKEIAAKIEELEKQGAKKLVLDLRHCATGADEDGIALANLFIDKGLITYTQGQKTARQDFQASASKAITKLPLAVMVNRGTAGAAEIAAAALLDTKRAELVGEKTYGDASIRKAIQMDDGSAVILSVAKYYSPDGSSIQDKGVTPNHQQADLDTSATTDDDDDTDTPPSTPRSDNKKDPLTGGDPILMKTYEIIKK